MGAICTVPVVDSDFWAVVLADPDLLDEAFAEVLGSWDAAPPSAPPSTLTANPARPTLCKQKDGQVVGGLAGSRW